MVISFGRIPRTRNTDCAMKKCIFLYRTHNGSASGALSGTCSSFELNSSHLSTLLRQCREMNWLSLPDRRNDELRVHNFIRDNFCRPPGRNGDEWARGGGPRGWNYVSEWIPEIGFTETLKMDRRRIYVSQNFEKLTEMLRMARKPCVFFPNFFAQKYGQEKSSKVLYLSLQKVP